jgi:hypothetical protein
MSTGMTDGMETNFKLLDDLLAEWGVRGKPA